MIRVMIVEDEPPILRVIAKFIESFDGAFQIVHTAMNGKKALEYLEHETVDVIFTDIKMPVMDGLELTEHIKARTPETIVVIISGFQDFGYARKALQFQVYDYLLKPIMQDAMSSVLSKIETELMAKDKEKHRQRIINVMNKKAPMLGDDTAEGGYAVLLICAGAFPLVPNDSMLPGSGIWETINLQGKLMSIVSDQENSMCFNGKTASEQVVVFEAKDEKAIGDTAEKLYDSLKAESTLPITLVLAPYSVKLCDIGQTLEKLRTKLYISIKLLDSHILRLDHGESEASAALDVPLIRETIRSAALAQGEQLVESILAAVKKLTGAGFTQLQAAAFFYDILYGVDHKNGNSIKDTAGLKMDIDTALSHATDDSSLAKDIAFILLGLNEKEDLSNDKSTISDIAKQIEDYLKNHYKEPITTTMLSKKFGFVPSYISKLFRNYKGMSPSEYLTYYRIEKSKQIMLNDPDKMIKEVAAMVGFGDQYHFSKTFKKQTGAWPSEYANKKQ